MKNTDTKTLSLLTDEEVDKMNAYWRAANYLSVGQIYLLDNPLLREPLKPEHIKPRLLGHWGTTPGLNFIYVHMNRLIKKHDLNMIYIAGPGHGGPGLVANTYLEQNAPKVAEYYFARILDNCADLEIGGESIHLACLQNLIRITDSPELQIRYYSDLITRFADKIDLGYSYFMLARSYETLGEWDLAIQTYTQFLSYGRYDILIPGVPDAYEYAKRIVDYNTSSKDWTFDSLDDLVAAVEKAIDGYDYRALDRYRAKVNFFAMSWKQEQSDNNAQADFQMQDFMGGNRIRYNETLDASSNPNEAFLRTSGWNQYVSVWYFYFRKVNFPADPDIHGRWEWAGIYYGEKL